jgi:hypothetical protein
MRGGPALLLCAAAVMAALAMLTSNNGFGDDVHRLLLVAEQTFPEDAAAWRKARATIRHVEIMSNGLVNHEKRTVRRGQFDRDNGVLRVAVSRPNGKPLQLDIARGVLVHEVAHAACDKGDHSPEWRRLFVKLLHVATEDLGWHVALECGSCTLYGICSAVDCAKCTWTKCA